MSQIQIWGFFLLRIFQKMLLCFSSLKHAHMFPNNVWNSLNKMYWMFASWNSRRSIPFLQVWELLGAMWSCLVCLPKEMWETSNTSISWVIAVSLTIHEECMSLLPNVTWAHVNQHLWQSHCTRSTCNSLVYTTLWSIYLLKNMFHIWKIVHHCRFYKHYL